LKATLFIILILLALFQLTPTALAQQSKENIVIVAYIDDFVENLRFLERIGNQTYEVAFEPLRDCIKFRGPFIHTINLEDVGLKVRLPLIGEEYTLIDLQQTLYICPNTDKPRLINWSLKIEKEGEQEILVVKVNIAVPGYCEVDGLSMYNHINAIYTMANEHTMKVDVTISGIESFTGCGPGVTFKRDDITVTFLVDLQTMQAYFQDQDRLVPVGVLPLATPLLTPYTAAKWANHTLAKAIDEYIADPTPVIKVVEKARQDEELKFKILYDHAVEFAYSTLGLPLGLRYLDFNYNASIQEVYTTEDMKLRDRWPIMDVDTQAILDWLSWLRNATQNHTAVAEVLYPALRDLVELGTPTTFQENIISRLQMKPPNPPEDTDYTAEVETTPILTSPLPLAHEIMNLILLPLPENATAPGTAILVQMWTADANYTQLTLPSEQLEDVINSYPIVVVFDESVLNAIGEPNPVEAAECLAKIRGKALTDYLEMLKILADNATTLEDYQKLLQAYKEKQIANINNCLNPQETQQPPSETTTPTTRQTQTTTPPPTLTPTTQADTTTQETTQQTQTTTTHQTEEGTLERDNKLAIAIAATLLALTAALAYRKRNTPR